MYETNNIKIDDEIINSILDDKDFQFISTLKYDIENNYLANLRDKIEGYTLFSTRSKAAKHSAAIRGLLYTVGIDLLKNAFRVPATFFNPNEWLIEFKIPDTVEILESSCFRNSANLERITLPTSIEQINEYVFVNCPKLKEIIYEGTKKQFESITAAEDAFSLINSPGCKLIFTDRVVEL